MQLITLELFTETELQSCFTKTSPVFYPRKTTPSDVSWQELLEQTFPLRPEQPGTNGLVLVRLPAQNAKRRGECLTLNFSVSPNDAKDCSLSQVLQKDSIHPKYFLSPRACQGILTRVKRREKTLPTTLKIALLKQAKAISDETENSMVSN